jgi:hypothetical protein
MHQLLLKPVYTISRQYNISITSEKKRERERERERERILTREKGCRIV